MKNIRLSLIAAGLIGLLAGCGTTNTFSSRIKENQAAFDKLTPVDQDVVRSGFIKIGYPKKVVYIALENPEKKIPGPSANEETWIYHNFYSSDGQSNISGQKVKTNFAGGGSGGAKQPAGGAPRGYNNTFSVEADNSADQIKLESMIKVHVKFVDGKVVSIDIVRPH